MKDESGKTHRMWGVLAVVALLAAGCTSDNASNAADPNACLNEVKGKGDLEITDSTLTQMNPDASKDFLETYAVEVTNRSKTETAAMAGFLAEPVDGDGRYAGESEAVGRLEFIAPGESQYFASASFSPSENRSSELKVTLPRGLLDDDRARPVTYWMPEDDVNYPDNPQASNVSLSEDGKLRFDVDNDSQKHFKDVEALILLRDSSGKVIGGRETMSTKAWKLNDRAYDWPDIDVPPGRGEASMTPFPDGLPPAADPSRTEVQLRAPYDFTKIDPDCKFDFSKE